MPRSSVSFPPVVPLALSAAKDGGNRSYWRWLSGGPSHITV